MLNYPIYPLIITFTIVVFGLWISNKLLITNHPEYGNEKLFPRQLTMLGLTVIGILAIVLALPIKESSMNQLITLIGLVLSGIFAFSSSTIFANLMAGIMLRMTRPFKTGDFIQIKEHFGRVVERGLLDTEIQTEQKELLALPNIYLISHPIATTSSTGTIISTTLSLGYDAHHAEIETLLLKAATLCELENPFVHILRLDDYSVVYKISGVLKDVKSLLSARSKLCSCVLDTLHENNVEIMSPAFVNQKRLPEAFNTIPLKKSKRNQTETKKVDSEIFDKAEAAAELEQTRARIMSEIEALKQTLKDADSETSNSIQNRIDNLLESLKSLEQKDLS